MSREGLYRQFYATICGNVMTFCFGVTVGWSSSSVVKLMSDDTPLSSGPLTLDQGSWISSVMCLGGAFSTVFYGWMSEKVGRKLSLLCLAFPTLAGWMFIEYGTNVYHLYVARFLGGFGGGGSFILVPVYVTEISSDAIRGTLGSLTVLSHNLGILVSFIACSYANYYTVPFIGIIASIIFFVGCLSIPESPKYLMEKGRIQEANAAAEWLGHEIVPTSSEKFVKQERLKFKDLCEPTARRGFTLGIILITLTCSSGAFVLLSYTETIFRDAGSSVSPELSSIIVAILQILGSYVATFLVESAGRKFLIITSSCLAATFLTLMGVYSLMQTLGYCTTQLSWIPIVCLSTVVFVAANGSASLPYVVLCEILSQKIRAFVSTVCLLEDWVLAFAYLKFLPYMITIWGLYGTLWFFAGINICLSILLYFMLPETKGKSINEIICVLKSYKW